MTNACRCMVSHDHRIRVHQIRGIRVDWPDPTLPNFVARSDKKCTRYPLSKTYAPVKVDQGSPKSHICYTPMPHIVWCTRKTLSLTICLHLSVFWHSMGCGPPGPKFTNANLGSDVQQGPHYQAAKFRPFWQPVSEIGLPAAELRWFRWKHHHYHHHQFIIIIMDKFLVRLLHGEHRCITRVINSNRQ